MNDIRSPNKVNLDRASDRDKSNEPISHSCPARTTLGDATEHLKQGFAVLTNTVFPRAAVANRVKAAQQTTAIVLKTGARRWSENSS